MSLIGIGSTTYNVANIRADYASLTANDFLLVITGNTSLPTYWRNGSAMVKGNLGGLAISTNKSYNSSTGVLTVSGAISYTGNMTDDDGNYPVSLNRSLGITSVIAVYCKS